MLKGGLRERHRLRWIHNKDYRLSLIKYPGNSRKLARPAGAIMR